jgi:cytochrome P450
MGPMTRLTPATDRGEATDLADAIMFTDPFPRYAELRRDAPVSSVRSKQLLPGGGFLLTRYDDVKELHTDKRFSSQMVTNRRPGLMKIMPRTLRLLADSMAFKDDPDHLRLRGLVNRAFTPKRVQEMCDDIDRVVASRIGALRRGEVVDLVEEYAVAIPLAVISMMMGVGRADQDEFHERMRKLAADAVESPAALIKGMPNGRQLTRLLERLADERRVDPDDRLISALVQANDEGDRLDQNEVLAMTFLLLLAGHDTTANLIGSSVLALIEHPDQLARLREDPSLVDSAVEEFLRFTTPVPCGVARVALEDVEFSGTPIPKGSGILGMIISANRDESVFEDPDTLDLGRTPNRHLSFGFGSHFCLGNQLARFEGRAALNALVQTFDHIELAVPRSALEYKPTQSLRGLRSLPLRLR